LANYERFLANVTPVTHKHRFAWQPVPFTRIEPWIERTHTALPGPRSRPANHPDVFEAMYADRAHRTEVTSVSRRNRLAAISCALALSATTAAAAEQPQINVLDRPSDRLEHALDVHKQVTKAVATLRAGTAKAKRIAAKAKPDFGLAGGVSQSTLDAIAACESGGDPTAVDSSGTYYGLYQFDMGTWASVGGHGSPAAASPAEQSYRASLLYSRAGSSPWPVCGV
jgi:soluble lytic murein transglycosylase-like protein